MQERLTSSYPPPAGTVPKADPKPATELTMWLSKGWQAKCCSCSYHFVSHDKPSDARCPRCNDLPTMATAMAAIATMPQPQTDAWNKREAKRTQRALAAQERAAKAKPAKAGN